MRQSTFPLVALAIWVSSSVVPVGAREHPHTEKGLGADTAYHQGQFDTVNLFNGNLTLDLSLGPTYPMRDGFSYGFGLNYNSVVWNFSDSECDGFVGRKAVFPDAGYQAGLGWRLSFGGSVVPTTTGTWTYFAPGGGQHEFFPRLYDLVAADAHFYTRDGSYLRLRTSPGGGVEIDFPDGKIRSFDSAGRLILIRDRFVDSAGVARNRIKISYPADGSWKIKDTRGRTQVIRFRTDGPGKGQIASIESTAFGGETATYTFVYEDRSVYRHRDNCPTTSTRVTVPLLQRIKIPDGSAYRFLYHLESGETTAGSLPGAIRQMVLPTHGRYEWTYDEVRLPSFQGSDRIDRVRTKTMKSAADQTLGVWHYEPILLNQSSLQNVASRVTVTDPLGHQTRHFFSLALTLDRQWAYGAPFTWSTTDSTGTRYLSREVWSAGSKLRSEYVRFESDPPRELPGQRTAYTKRVASRRTVYHDDPLVPFAEETFSDFDGLGNYRTVTRHGSFQGVGERKVTTRYNPARGTFDYDITNSSFGPGHTFTLPPTDGPWVLTTFDQRQIQEGGETATSEFCFEADTGFLLRHRIRKNTGRSADDLLHVFSRNARGDLTRERYFGARDGGLSTGSLCTLALPTEDAYRVDHTYRSGVRQTSAFKDASGAGLGFLSLDLDIDWSTGLAAASRDSAGLETAYEYDILGRLEWIKPASGQLGWTQMSYSRATIAPSSPATVQVRRRGNGSEQAAVLAQTVRRFDEFGRPTLHEIALPDGSASGTWGVRETEYNPMGWVTSISERDDGAAAGRTRYLDFDAFGRPGRILLPDDHEVRIEYEGVRRVTRTESIGTARSSPGGQIVETDVSRSEIYDRLGRLVAVEEPSGPSGAAVTTAYSYDLLGHLTESQTTAATASQTRCYDYDWRGFALSTAHPEKGKISSGCDADDGRVFFSDHDALGNATRIVDGPNDLTLTFDRASRVTQIDETDGRPLKSMTYATGNSAGWSQGKLIRAKRHNYLEPAVPLDAVVTQRFTYGGRGGAIDHVRTEVSTGEAFEQSYSYNPLGQVATIDYPDCAPDHPFCDDGNLPAAPTVSYEYTDGFLTSIPGYANALAYHSNGRLRQVVHSNGVIDTVALDPDRMRRPASISTTGATCPTFGGCPWTSGSDGDWTSGEFVYDGTGSPVRIGDDWYLYDSVGRVVEGTALSAGPGRRQTYTYDAFGNVRSIRTEEGGSPVVQTLAVDARTNRLTDTLYDGAGNQTSYFTYKYSFDAFNQLSRFEGDGEDWVYLYDAAGLRLAAYQVLTGFTHWYLRAPGGKLLTYLIDNRSTATVQVFRLRDYIYRGSSLLATRVLGSTTRHTHVDQLRTPRLVTDADGRVYSYHAYFPYGRQATDENQVFEPVQFTGAERDSHGQPEDFDDLDYMRARHYHAHNARFLNVDPLKGDPLRPQSHNRYAYAQGNPMRFTDPTGLKAKDEAKCQDDEKGDGNGCETAAEPEPDPKGVFTDTIDVAGFSDPVDLVGRTLPDPPAGHGFYQRSFYPRALMHPFVVSLELAEKAVIGDGSIMRCARSRPPQTRDAHFLAGLLHYVYAGSSPAKVVKSGFIALGGAAAVTGGLVADTVSSPFRYLDGDLIAPSLGLPAGTDRPITGVAAVTAVEVLADQLIRPVFDENCARTSPNFTFMN